MSHTNKPGFYFKQYYYSTVIEKSSSIDYIFTAASGTILPSKSSEALQECNSLQMTRDYGSVYQIKGRSLISRINKTIKLQPIYHDNYINF